MDTIGVNWKVSFRSGLFSVRRFFEMKRWTWSLAIAVLLGGTLSFTNADYIIIVANVGVSQGKPGDGGKPGPGGGVGAAGAAGAMGAAGAFGKGGIPPGGGAIGGPIPPGGGAGG